MRGLFKVKNYSKLIFLSLLVFSLFFIVACSSDIPEDKNEVEEDTEEISIKEDEELEEVEEENDVPREYKSALKKAETYSDMMHMSKAGIYDQLTSEHGEQFPEEAAQYAIDNIKADWKANALEKAKTYAETMDMSNAAIYDQLISDHGEKFTEEEAQYAVDNLN